MCRAETFYDSSSISDNLSYFFVSAHTLYPVIYYCSDTESGYSIDNIAPDGTQVIITRTESQINLSWDEVIYGSFQGNPYPELNGIWYRIYSGNKPEFD